ncbi:hypothetical protein M434DRAFT_19159 [Hypoxylon sp. CO27-5]|nr:hypothetical protein M434DRAFT_19159 [Hypoxylon sp. CO27-5]
MFGQKTSGLDGLLHRSRPSAWQLLLQNPCIFLARKLYSWRRLVTPFKPPENAVSVVCISDTHNSQCSLPDGDILIHAGDLTQSGSFEELQATITWLQNQPHSVKIVIAGNHDLLLDASRPDIDGKAVAMRKKVDWGDIIYLEDSATTAILESGRHVNIYGSPRSPKHGNWAFQYLRQTDVWRNSVPNKTDILVTHTPPRAHLDLTTLGCQHLLRELWRVHPTLHVFGHVHEGYGHEWVQFDAVQQAYERTILAGGGRRNLFSTLHALICSFFRSPIIPACQLVNPSIVGGLRDDVRRQPIKVYI